MGLETPPVIHGEMRDRRSIVGVCPNVIAMPAKSVAAVGERQQRMMEEVD